MLGVRGGLLKKTPLPHIVLRLRPATIVCREEKPEGTNSALKTIPYGKKHECSPPSYCNSLVRDLSGSSCGHPRFILRQRLSKLRAQIVHN